MTARAALFPFLKALSAETFTSGEVLARELGVSRASVSLLKQRAEEIGVAVNSRHGVGYALERPIEWLSAERIAALRRDNAARIHVSVFDALDSSNSALLRAAEADAPTHSVYFVESQSAGRGRLGRGWVSEIGGGLAMSYLWRFPHGAERLAGLSLAVGVALIDALGVCGIEGVQLKWPNDLVWHGCKVGGILIETAGDMLGPITVVIGIGLNVRLSAPARESIDQAVADLTQVAGTPPSRNALAAAILDALAGMLETFGAHGFAPFRDVWQRHAAYLGKRVRVSARQAAAIEGTLTGVDERGALLVDVSGTTKTIVSGELSLRPAA